MRIHQINQLNSKNLINVSNDTVDNSATGNGVKNSDKLFFYNNQAEVNLSISMKGREALRENLKELGIISEYREFEVGVISNRVFLEHSRNMQEIISKNYNSKEDSFEDYAESIIVAYETIYNQLVQEHQKGYREVTYDDNDHRFITWEEDLAALDEAFENSAGVMGGYITTQQVNKQFANQEIPEYIFRRLFGYSYGKGGSEEDYNYIDEDYIKTALNMMKQAKEKFLALFQSPNYKQGAAVGIITGIMNRDADFMNKTRKLFS